jgi:hypothetical protein
MMMMEYDPQTWTPDDAPDFIRTEVGQQLTPLFRRIHSLTEGPYDAEAHSQAVFSYRKLVRPERLLSPEEEFVASRMSYVARQRLERWSPRPIG